jgi:hypothetical protein
MASTRITRTLSANGDKKLTISAWIKRSKISDAQYICRVFSDPNNQGGLYFTSGDNIEWFDYVGGAYKLRYITNAVYRDTSAWYHILAHFDNSLSTPEAKLYVNGVEQSLSTSTNYTQNQTTSWNNNYTFDIGSASTGTYFDGSMAHFYFIQNQKYAPTIFGESDSVSAIWKPIASPTIDYSATGSNSCFLKFENSGNMDLDSGSNNVSFTTSGTLTQNVDTPSNNFATLNPLDVSRLANTGNTFSNGNLTVTDGASSYLVAQSTLATTTGKFYWEVKINATASDTASGVGIVDLDNFSRADGAGNTAYGWIYAPDGDKRNSGTSTAYGDTYAANDIIGIALDMTNGFLYFSKNGTWQNSGNPESGASGTGSAYGSVSGTIGAHAYDGSGSIAHEYSFNFGQGYFGTTAVASAGTSPSEGGIFEYDCPSGYQALCTKGINSF